MDERRPKKHKGGALLWVERVCLAPRVTLEGSSRALIENVTGICEFSREEVRLMTRQGFLTVTGRGLCLTQVGQSALMVEGCLRGIGLPPLEETP